LSVGRLSLREAMQGLQTMGPVEVRHGVGTFFTSEPSRWLLSPLRFSNTSPRRLFAELVEAPLLVEVRLAALAAERATREDIAASKRPPKDVLTPRAINISRLASTSLSRSRRPPTRSCSRRC
jgi:GntR family transcriptional repressor for pyruvate dehydrogenase complex